MDAPSIFVPRDQFARVPKYLKFQPATSVEGTRHLCNEIAPGRRQMRICDFKSAEPPTAAERRSLERAALSALVSNFDSLRGEHYVWSRTTRSPPQNRPTSRSQS